MLRGAHDSRNESERSRRSWHLQQGAGSRDTAGSEGHSGWLREQPSRGRGQAACGGRPSRSECACPRPWRRCCTTRFKSEWRGCRPDYVIRIKGRSIRCLKKWISKQKSGGLCGGVPRSKFRNGLRCPQGRSRLSCQEKWFVTCPIGECVRIHGLADGVAWYTRYASTRVEDGQEGHRNYEKATRSEGEKRGQLPV